MPEPQEAAPDENGPALDANSDEIARSLGSVWQRYSGQRPKSTSVEIGAHTVTCVIEERSPDAETEDEDEAAGDRLSPAGLQYQATAAIARVTGRRVIAFIPKRDKKTETSTQTFILDRPRKRF